MTVKDFVSPFKGEGEFRRLEAILVAEGYKWCSGHTYLQWVTFYNEGVITVRKGEMSYCDIEYYRNHIEDYAGLEMIDKLAPKPAAPPSGLRPKSLVDRNRILEITEAMQRYVAEGKEVPAEWLAELADLIWGKAYVIQK